MVDRNGCSDQGIKRSRGLEHPLKWGRLMRLKTAKLADPTCLASARNLIENPATVSLPCRSWANKWRLPNLTYFSRKPMPSPPSASVRSLCNYVKFFYLLGLVVDPLVPIRKGSNTFSLHCRCHIMCERQPVKGDITGVWFFLSISLPDFL